MPRVPGQPFLPAHFLQGLGHREAADYDRHLRSGATALTTVGLSSGFTCLIWVRLGLIREPEEICRGQTMGRSRQRTGRVT
jgi:hypothetical protein